MKLNERMKRRLAVLGCVVVGAVLIAAIGSQFKGCLLYTSRCV